MRRTGLAIILSVALAGCGEHGKPQAADNSLNIYTWADYIAPDTVPNFERETGITVRYAIYESNEVLATKLLTGHTNYDIVVPTDFYFDRLLKAGAFHKLDRTLLPNLKNLDPEIMQRLGARDPGNQYAVPYLWFTTGIGYNVDKVRERLGSGEIDSWSILFDPKNAAKLADCGILVIDAPSDVLASMLIYLGKDPQSQDPADWTLAADTLQKIRPYVRAIDSLDVIPELVNGNLCLVLGWSGDVMKARYGAREAGNGVNIRYFIPEEGGLIGADMMAIPADAPHPANAEKWLNYLMRPEVMAGITNAVKYPNGNQASLPFVEPAIRNDPEIYPSAETRAKLHIIPAMTPDQARLATRLWTRFRTGQ